MALGTLYPFGYAAPGASQYLATLMARPRTLLVDIRYEAWSRRKEWNPSSLRHRYGKRYRPLRGLGNKNYNNDGPVELFMPEVGIPLLVEGLQKGYNLVLMCACKDYQHCHRKKVLELVLRALPDAPVDMGTSLPEPPAEQPGEVVQGGLAW